MRRNLGHQRAIAIGLAYVEAEMSQDLVIVMDADGEDNPYKIDKLLTKYYQAKTPQIVFARRSKRSESRKFQLFIISIVECISYLRVKKFHLVTLA